MEIGYFSDEAYSIEYGVMLGSLILVIDDDPKTKQALEFSFPEYKFAGVSNGETGLDLLQKPNEVELVILDLKLEQMGGIETLKKIKENHPRIGVFLITACGSKEMVIQALENHADDFIDKPYAVDPLRMKLRRFFDSQPFYRERGGNYNPQIQKIMRLLEKNHEKFLTLQDASEIVSLSPKYISRLFKKETHRRFTEFRTALKIRHAKRILKSSSCTINEVADKIGYQNTASFIKMFKKFTNRTPTEYRHKNSNF